MSPPTLNKMCCPSIFIKSLLNPSPQKIGVPPPPPGVFLHIPLDCKIINYGYSL